MSRTTNSLRNAAVSTGGQILNSLLKFACRTVFIYTLGKEYLGISSLYTNVLTILSLSELGFSTAVTYSLYEPLAKGDRETVRSLMAFFRKVYRIVGLTVLLLGLCLMPFLPRLMTGVTDKVNIYHYYLIYLAQPVISYLFFAYKAVMLSADQKGYISGTVSIFCNLALNLMKILVLVVWRSFFLYTAVAIVTQIAQNIIVSVLVDRRYPYLKKPAKPLASERKKDLYHRVYATFLQKISITVTNATDNLVISAFVGMVAVGLYNNYYLIISTVRSFLSGIFGAMTASLGNLFVTESKERSAFVFRSLNMGGNLLAAICSVCFLVLFQPFILLWAGEEYLLDRFTMWTIVLNFATIYLQSMVQIYRDATGLTVVGKYRSVINAALNLIISVILVKPLGMAGVFLGSVIARLAVNWWFDAWVLHRKGFGCSPVGYYLRYLLSLALIVLSYVLVETLCGGLPEATWANLIIRAVLSVAVTGGLYLAIYGRSEEMKYLVEKGKTYLARK